MVGKYTSNMYGQAKISTQVIDDAQGFVYLI
jgi:hypothetical protein